MTKNIDGITYCRKCSYENCSTGQVTIPQTIRDKLGITPVVEIDFIEEIDQIYMTERDDWTKNVLKFKMLSRTAKVKVATYEIMALIRVDK